MSRNRGIEQHTIIEGQGPFRTNIGPKSYFLVHVIGATIRNSPPHFHKDGRHIYIRREGRRFNCPKPRTPIRTINPNDYLDSDYYNPNGLQRMSTEQSSTGNLSRVRRIIRDVIRHHN